MCQATVYLNEEIIMKDVMIVEPIPEGVRLIALFEPVQVVPATIRRIDLMKHRIILESLPESERKHEQSGETQGSEPV